MSILVSTGGALCAPGASLAAALAAGGPAVPNTSSLACSEFSSVLKRTIPSLHFSNLMLATSRSVSV